MPDPIPHAEMLRWMRAHCKWVEPHDTEMAEAVLLHLERTQPPDTQADLTERARAITKSELIDAVEYLNDHFGEGYWPPVHRLPELLAGFAERRLQSEREAAAAEARPCAKIFEHKWLDPECVEAGCRTLILKAALNAMLDEFRTVPGSTAQQARDTAKRALASPPAPQEETPQ